MAEKNKSYNSDYIKSAQKRSLIVLFGLLLILVGVIAIANGPKGVKIGDEYFRLEKVSTSEELSKGLSGRDSLAENRGMLFVFNGEGNRCMWMKDMNFALDILWLDTSGNIVAVEEDVLPESYPKSYCHDDAKYVIELNSGVVSESSIVVGQTVEL